MSKSKCDVFRVKPGDKFELGKRDPDATPLSVVDKAAELKELQRLGAELDALQDVLYANQKRSLLLVLQGMDTAGKDGTVRAVFNQVNPRGVNVASFKVPTDEEKAHDFLWRVHAKTPRAGEVVIFNRSHYEDVLITWVHGWIDDAERKRRIRESRVQGTRAVVEALRAARTRPAVLISCSAVGYYGDRGAEVLREDAGPGQGFLAEVCVDWEREAQAASELGIRVALPRTGIVLAREGGALPKMALPFKLGVGGRLGSGAQYFPWIHLEDMAGLLAFALEREAVRGPLNAVAPHPVTNRELTETLARTLHRPAVVAVPRFALELALGEMAGATLEGQRASAEKAIALGYAFAQPLLGPALRNLLG